MAKGRPPPAFLQKGKGASPPARGRMPTPPPRRPPGPPMAPPDETSGMPAFRGGGKVKRK